MNTKRMYETVFVLHPELTEEDVEASVRDVVNLLEGKDSEIIRTERGGKRRLAYPVRKQRYGYYNLIHFRAGSEALTELERLYRLSDRFMRHLTVRFDKEEQLTSLTRMGDDEGRDDDRDDRRRGGGRRGESFRSRTYEERRPTVVVVEEKEEEEVEAALEPAEPSVSSTEAEELETTPEETMEQVPEEAR